MVVEEVDRLCVDTDERKWKMGDVKHGGGMMGLQFNLGYFAETFPWS